MKKRIKSLNIKYIPQKLYYNPEWIILGVNNLCNLHCKMCDVGTNNNTSNFYHHLMESKPLNMPLDLIFRAIDQVSLYFPAAKLGYAFTEPLIYPHLIESIKYATSKNIYTSVTTNALKLEELAELLAEAKLNELFISLDGPPEIHNHIRGHKNSFSKAIKGIEKIQSFKDAPTVSIFCTITEWNIGFLLEFAELFRAIPLQEIGFMHTNFTPQNIADLHNQIFQDSYPATSSNMDDISIDNMDLDRLWKDISDIKKTSFPFPVSFSPEFSIKSKFIEFYKQPEKIIGNICNDAFRAIMLKSDGSVIPAHGRCYKVIAGNLYKQTLSEIWNAQPLAAFRKTLVKHGGLLPACSRCCSAF